MISRFDIEERVREWGLREDVVEKDYVIGWLLWGIGSHPVLGEMWAFKGGTCLKKCYVETYRFSEDLDFTVLPGGPIAPSEVESLLSAVLERVAEASGIDFSRQVPALKAHESGRYTAGRVYYVGPRRTPTVARVKLDLSGSEVLARPTVRRVIAHAYPDALPDPATALCYRFEEVFAEKIRALGERARPRDLYDVVNLFRRQDMETSLSSGEIRAVLVDKCRTKGVPVPTLLSVRTAERREEVKSEWENMLRHQLPELPPFEDFWMVLPEVFDWLEGRSVAADLEDLRVPGQSIEAGWAPPATVATWGWPISLETIRFAAANRLCVELGYGGSRRIIEPYSLRQSRAGDLLLFAVRVDSGESRAYRVDRIESVRATQRTFNPRHRVELTAFGALQASPVAMQRRSVVPPTSRRPVRSGLVYMVECPYCRKRFRRTSMAKQQLREHKAPGGFRCLGSGRRGQLVETRPR